MTGGGGGNKSLKISLGGDVVHHQDSFLLDWRLMRSGYSRRLSTG
jgi:hypothetical protein